MSDNKTEIGPDAEISLREITEETLGSILRLSVTEEQKHYIANNAVSIAQAHFSKFAWFRAIYADDTPVGFVMFYDDSDTPEYFLWRFMIDARYQGKGFGRRAMDLLIDYVKSRPNASKLRLSYHPGDGSPEGFYLKMGFENTGEIMAGENVMVLKLGNN